MMILCLVSQTDVAERVLHDGLEDVRRLHSDLLRETAMGLCSICALLHVKLVDHNFENVKFFGLKVSQKLLIRSVSRI